MGVASDFIETDPKPAVGVRARDWFRRSIDRAIPKHMLAGDPERLQQVRSIVGFTYILIVIALESAAYFYWALPLENALFVELSLAVSILLSLSLPLVLRHSETAVPAANIVITAGFMSILTAITAMGGIHAPLLHWCALPPMLAVLMGAKRSAWIWVGLGISGLAGFIAIDAMTTGPTSQSAFVEITGISLWVQRAVDVSSWLLVLTTTAFLYERHKDDQTLRLARMNEELRSEMAQRQRAEDRTRYLAYYDELTTLPNRQLFKEHLAQAMEAADRDGLLVGLLFVDLDGFKEINDNHGHSSGDALLQMVSSRLLNCVRGVDHVSRQTSKDAEFVSRLGGDEFTILLDRLQDFSQAAIVAKRVLDALSAPFLIDSQELLISASIGIGMHSGNVMTMDELLRNADLAMYHAKKEGRNNFQFFEPHMNESVVERTTMANALRLALERDEFELYYQPIVCGRTLEIIAVECLLRWNDPERGFVPPDVFIGVAEQSGQIIDIGDWVIEQACTQYGKWKSDGIAPKRIAINVSGQQFRNQRVACALITSVEEAQIDPACVEIEITETAMMIDEAEASRCLAQLKKFGVSIALDDFGTGFSSLSYIRRFPVDALKIDRSFVEAIESNSEAHAITTAILAMAKRLDLRVVAEGIETASQAKLLVDEDCDELQGYFFSKPMSGAQMTKLLRTGIPDPYAGSETRLTEKHRTH